MKGLLEKRREKKKGEEIERRSQLIEQLKAVTKDSLEVLRQIKSRSPQGSSYPGHQFHFNNTVYEVQTEYIRRQLSGTGVTMEEIGISAEELAEIWRAAARADIIVDAPEFGLTVTENQDSP